MINPSKEFWTSTRILIECLEVRRLFAIGFHDGVLDLSQSANDTEIKVLTHQEDAGWAIQIRTSDLWGGGILVSEIKAVVVDGRGSGTRIALDRRLFAAGIPITVLNAKDDLVTVLEISDISMEPNWLKGEYAATEFFVTSKSGNHFLANGADEPEPNYIEPVDEEEQPVVEALANDELMTMSETPAQRPPALVVAATNDGFALDVESDEVW